MHGRGPFEPADLFPPGESERLTDAAGPDGVLEHDISGYLARTGFADRVMIDLTSGLGRARRVALWAGLCLVNLCLLILFATGGAAAPEFLAVQRQLRQFVFLFLGISLLGSLIGLVLASDVSWIGGKPAGRSRLR